MEVSYQREANLLLYDQKKRDQQRREQHNPAGDAMRYEKG
jgi:hypothetical protein